MATGLIETGEEEEEGVKPLTLGLIMITRCFLGTTAGLVHITGFWAFLRASLCKVRLLCLCLLGALCQIRPPASVSLPVSQIDSWLVPWASCGAEHYSCYSYRNIGYVLIGAIVLGSAGTLQHHACVSPSHVVPWLSKDEQESRLKLRAGGSASVQCPV